MLITNLRTYQLVDRDGQPVPWARREKSWRVGLERTLEAISGSSRVMVLADTPNLHRNSPLGCLRQHPESIAACQMPRARTMSERHDRAEQAAARAYGGSFVTMNPQICPYDPCALIVNELLLWRDSHHLTATYARQLAPSLAVMLARALG